MSYARTEATHIFGEKKGWKWTIRWNEEHKRSENSKSKTIFEMPRAYFSAIYLLRHSDCNAPMLVFGNPSARRRATQGIYLARV